MSLNESEACAVDVSMIENIESDVHFYRTMTNNLVRTNHTDFYHVSTHIHIFISVI